VRIWSTLTSLFARKAAPSSYTSGDTGGMPLGGDRWRKHAPPSSYELLQENLGTAYACATLNADLLSRRRCGCTSDDRPRRAPGEDEPARRHPRRRPARRSARLKAEPARRLEACARPGRSRRCSTTRLLDLLNRPNPLADGVGMSLYELFNFTQLYQEVVGKAYWYCERDGLGGTPSTIWILASHQVREVCDGSSDRIIDYYEFNGRTATRPTRSSRSACPTCGTRTPAASARCAA
jgi:hypothetical protein